MNYKPYSYFDSNQINSFIIINFLLYFYTLADFLDSDVNFNGFCKGVFFYLNFIYTCYKIKDFIILGYMFFLKIYLSNYNTKYRFGTENGKLAYYDDNDIDVLNLEYINSYKDLKDKLKKKYDIKLVNSCNYKVYKLFNKKDNQTLLNCLDNKEIYLIEKNKNTKNETNFNLLNELILNKYIYNIFTYKINKGDLFEEYTEIKCDKKNSLLLNKNLYEEILIILKKVSDGEFARNVLIKKDGNFSPGLINIINDEDYNKLIISYIYFKIISDTKYMKTINLKYNNSFQNDLKYKYRINQIIYISICIILGYIIPFIFIKNEMLPYSIIILLTTSIFTLVMIWYLKKVNFSRVKYYIG